VAGIAQVAQVGQGPNLYSREKEAALAALDYVQRVGATIAAELPEPRFTYAFAVTSSKRSSQACWRMRWFT
jgi:hypothetical protein